MKLEVERLFDSASQLPLEQRAEFLARACPDPLLRAEVAALLECASGVESYFEAAVKGVQLSLRNSRELTAGDATAPDGSPYQ